VLVAAGFAFAVIDAAAESGIANDPGLQALDTLADLKRRSDTRHAACMRTFADRPYCNCVNGRLPLDLTFIDYVAIVAEEPGGSAIPPAVAGYASEARAVRDRCTAITAPR